MNEVYTGEKTSEQSCLAVSFSIHQLANTHIVALDVLDVAALLLVLFQSKRD